MDPDNALIDPFVRILEQISPPDAVRQAETGTSSGLWDKLVASGFVDALVPESRGGADLSPSDVAPLLVAAGRHLLPVPFGDTLVARALAPEPLPVETPVLLWPNDASGRLRSMVSPVAGGATHALVQKGCDVDLIPLAVATEVDGFGLIGATPKCGAPSLLKFRLSEDVLFNWAAALTTASMAGAMGKMLDMTLGYVNERQQFGRPLAKFQAIQQQVSVFAERVAVTNVGARMAFSGTMPCLNPLDVAIAKVVTDESAVTAAAIAHAVHGAIGMTWEHDLSLYIRRLKRWQLSFGSASAWSTKVGQARLAHPATTSLDFLRSISPFEPTTTRL